MRPHTRTHSLNISAHNCGISQSVNDRVAKLTNSSEMSNSSENMSVDEGGETTPHIEYQILTSAFERRIREFELLNVGFKHIKQFLVNTFEIYQMNITNAVNEFNMIKTTSYFSAEFERSFHIDEADENNSNILTEKREIHIPTINREINSTTDLREHFQTDVIDHIIARVDEVMIEGSGFTLSKINKIRVQIFKYEPLRGAGFIELPETLKNKRSLINLNNAYDECFKWSILAALYNKKVKPKLRKEAASYQRWEDTLNFDGIKFPVELKQIEKFMQQNPKIAINVYYFDEEKKIIVPCFLASKPSGMQYVHLLLLTRIITPYNKEVEWNVRAYSHYCCITNLSALVNAQLTKDRRKKFMCDRCLNYFGRVDIYEKHRKLCEKMNEYAIEMPSEPDNFVTFKNFRNTLKTPFIIYADTEAILKKPEKEVYSATCSTQVQNQHEVYNIGYYFKCDYDEKKSFYASYRGKDCVDWFMDQLKMIARRIFALFEDVKPMKPLTEEEEKEFNEATICNICKKELGNNIRVRDHCHLSGLYRGAAHQACNINYQISRSIPIVMHNLSGYDSHLFIKKLGSNKKIFGDICIIPNNSEKYISFIKTVQDGNFKNKNQIKLKFIDSLRFMPATLDSLASLLPSSKKKILMHEYNKSSMGSIFSYNLLLRKGVFPYEYIDKYEKLYETELPSKDKFFSTLTGMDISDEDYKHAKEVWKAFKIRYIAEYADLYLKTDVLLLADVFENFRETCYETYSLDPAYYFGAPGLSFDAMLKYTGISIELFTDVDMLMFAESGIRGGVCQITKRYVEANNKFMGEDFDPSKETSYLLYLDGNYETQFESNSKRFVIAKIFFLLKSQQFIRIRNVSTFADWRI